MTPDELDGWIPIGLFREGGRPVVEWSCFSGVRFTAPFLDLEIENAMRHPFRLLFRRRTPLTVLEERAATHPGIPPTGFIFHMSRCGSTLMAQMLAACPENVVVSEGWPLDSVLYADAWHGQVTAGDRRRWLDAMIRALGQPRAGGERRYFVKFDARHALDLPLVRSAFPKVPWIFVYRDPVEVMVSHLNEPTLWTAPGIVPIRGMPWPPGPNSGGLDYPARVMAAICEAALAAMDQGGGLPVNYTGLPGAMFGPIAAHFGCVWSVEEVEAMRAASMRHAKRPGEPFSADSGRKRREADSRVRDTCERIAGDVFRRLEARRAALL